jgi:ribulose-5-phosphate 4-epimerase/fuculose-1-phosphate aldolase
MAMQTVDTSQIGDHYENPGPCNMTRVPMPGIGQELTIQQELACALRILAAAGWTQNVAGHITWVADDGESLWVNPWGTWWQEVRASDILRVSLDGEVLEGKWGVTPAIFIHTELHRQRPDARIVVHNHPLFATTLAGMGRLPDITEQTGCMFDGELGMFDEFTGAIDNAEAGQQLAAEMGTATAAILVGHGAIVTGPTIQAAAFRSICFERMCELSYQILATGIPPVVIAPEVRASAKRSMNDPCVARSFWEGSVRALIAREPEVLD